MTFVSYAQNFEDVILNRALHDIKEGFYVDIGSNDPVTDSVSYGFYNKGWRGISVDPDESYVTKHKLVRPDDNVLKAFVGTGTKSVKLFVFENTGMTTAREDFARNHKKSGWNYKIQNAKPRTLNAILNKTNAEEVHWLKIDVEGMEGDVLASWGKSTVRPWVVVVESVLPYTRESTHEEWEHELSDRGYTFVYFDGLNRFYLHEKHADRMVYFGLSPNIFDEFSLSEHTPFVSPEFEQIQSLQNELNEREIKASSLQKELEATIADREQLVANSQAVLSEAIRAVREEASDNRARLDKQVAAAQQSQLDLSEQVLSLSASSEQAHLQLATLQSNAAKQEMALLDAIRERDLLNENLAVFGDEVSKLKSELNENQAVYENKIENLEAQLLEKQAKFDEELESVRANLKAEFDEELESVRANLKAEFDVELESVRANLQAEFDVELESVRANLQAEFDVELESVRANLQAEFDAELESVRANLQAESDAERHNSATRSADLRAQIEQLSENLNRANARTKGAELRAHTLLVQAEALQNSSSWRFTAPLRAASRVFGARVLKRRAITVAKTILRPVLAAGLKVVRALPLLKRGMLVAARRSPRIGGRFLRFAEARPAASINQSETPRTRNEPANALASDHDQRILYYYVDHTVGCAVNTGMQRVVRGLAVALLSANESIVFVRWSRELRALIRVNKQELQHLAKWHGPVVDQSHYPDPNDAEIPINFPEKGEGSWLVVPEIPNINQHDDSPAADIIAAAQVASLRTAFVFYDSIPLRHPEFANFSGRHTNYLQSLLLSDFVAPISEWSARDLVSHFTHHENAARSSQPKVKAISLPNTSTKLISNLKPENERKFMLAVGTIELRKNQTALLDAFQKFSESGSGDEWTLELVGNLHPNMTDELNGATNNNPRIRYRGPVSDDELARLYRDCEFTVFPSYDEGFGLPIVESLTNGKPCICANFGAMAEVASEGGCVTVDVRNSDEIARAISTLATDFPMIKKLKDEIDQRVETTWNDYSGSFLDQLDAQSDPVRNVGRIYYYVDQTAKYPANTGIQRVVRGLAHALTNIGARVTPVKWNFARQTFEALSLEEIRHLARWNGPNIDAWLQFDDFEEVQPGDWLLMPEVVSDPAGPQMFDIHARARAQGLKIAWVFYDAIPWKMREFYDSAPRNAHGQYMAQLGAADFVFSISDFSNNDLLRFMKAEKNRVPNLFERFLPIPLPGEFLQAERVNHVKSGSDRTIRILSVGTIEPRKNHLSLLRAFAQMQEKLAGKVNVELKLVGGRPFPDLAEQVDALILATPNIEWLEKVDDKKLREYYGECDFTVYPSLEEGFGLPILESLWNARPCVCRDSGSMAELAEGGGCLTVDTASVEQISDAMAELVLSRDTRTRLAQEAIARPFKTWDEYACEITAHLAKEKMAVRGHEVQPLHDFEAYYEVSANLKRRPLLSICITTYNRAGWLAKNLENIFRIHPNADPQIEILVCDNASTDNSEEVVQAFRERSDFTYHRNAHNVGMLGNLRMTSQLAAGQYVWIIGDDDLIMDEGITQVISAIRANPDAALIYLNYAYTREEDPTKVSDLKEFISDGIPIMEAAADKIANISELSVLSENFFTAIYCLVFRRDHALLAYSQDTSGRPFSSMLTCIPTTYHVLNKMMNEKGVWLGAPQLVVNMNVSWLKYAPLWILERIPEAIDTAEKNGAPLDGCDARRIDHLNSLYHWFQEILGDDPEGNRKYIDMRRVFSRFQHLEAFQAKAPELLNDYRCAFESQSENFPINPEDVYPEPHAAINVTTP